MIFTNGHVQHMYVTMSRMSWAQERAQGPLFMASPLSSLLSEEHSLSREVSQVQAQLLWLLVTACARI